MRVFLIALAATLFLNTTASAQKGLVFNTIKRDVTFHIIGKDSVNVSLNHEFNLIEDSCSQIIRQGHMNMTDNKFYGKIRDVSKLDNKIVLTEGNYTTEGLKDGYFITHYLNGNLEAKGYFKNNKYDGNWEIYYADGKPMLTFAAHADDIKIIDAWDNNGVKTLSNGTGDYRVDMDGIYWKGLLLEGKPDGVWKAVSSEDATHTTLISETYNIGKFVKGNSPAGEYKNAPRLALVPPDKLPFTHAEAMKIATDGCDVVKVLRKQIINAQYSGGATTFNDNIVKAVNPYFDKIDLKPYQNTIYIDGEINEDGKLTSLKAQNAFNSELANGLIRVLNTIPYMQPASVDGKPVKQKINMDFNFARGSYHFTYSFLPIQIN